MSRKKRLSLPRVIIGKKKGIKVRARFPSMMGGQISFTFASIAEAKRHQKKLPGFQKRRFKIVRV